MDAPRIITILLSGGYIAGYIFFAFFSEMGVLWQHEDGSLEEVSFRQRWWGPFALLLWPLWLLWMMLS